MGVDKANPKPEFPVPPEPTTGSLMVPRPGPGRAISKALCLDCAFPCGQARRPRPAGPGATPCGLEGGCPSAFAQLGHSPIGVTAAGSESVPASKHCHSALIVPMRHARCRVAVYGAPLSTLTTEWQCETHCHSTTNVPDALPLGPDRTVSVRSTPGGSVRCTATRP